MNDRPQMAVAEPFDLAANGWEAIVNHTAFGDLVGPIWRREDCGHPRFGFIVAPKHLNRAGNLHGGMLMTVADLAMAITARAATGGAIPVTVVWGRADQIIPPAQAESVSGAARHMIDGAGHMPQIERPADVQAAIEETIARAG